MYPLATSPVGLLRWEEFENLALFTTRYTEAHTFVIFSALLCIIREYFTLRSSPPSGRRRKVKVLFRWTHSQFFWVMQTACHWVPNCHSNTSRMHIKWLWIYLSHMLHDSKMAVHMVTPSEDEKSSQTGKKSIVAPSNHSQDFTNTISAGIAAPPSGSTSESGEWALVLQYG